VSKLGERLGLCGGGLRHRVDNRVDLLLSELGERVARLTCAPYKRARFVNGRQIAIGLGRGLRHA
jgi:hypothetical protein